MVPQNHHMPAWQKGLIKRKWIYLVVVIVSLLFLGDGYLKRLSIPRNKEKPTFEELAVRINQRDAILISTWRGIWAKLPVGIQSRVPHWAPLLRRIRFDWLHVLHWRVMGRKLFRWCLRNWAIPINGCGIQLFDLCSI